MAGWRIVLFGVSKTIQGLQWESGNHLRIGRQKNVEVICEDPSISRQHAEVLATPQGWFVRDLGSSTGTLLNGIPVLGTPRRVQAEDVLQFGNLAMKVAELEMETRPQAAGQKGPVNIKTTGAFVRVQAASQRSWEEGLQALDGDVDTLPQGKHFLGILRAGYHLSRIGSLRDLCQSVLDDTVQVLEADRGALVLMDPVKGDIAFQVTSQIQSPPKASKCFSNTLVMRCFSKGESMLCEDINTHADILSSGSVTHGGMTSIICVLLRSPRKRLGVLSLGRSIRQHPFTPNDLRLAEAIAASVSMGIEAALKVDQLQNSLLQQTLGLARLAVEARAPHTVASSGRVSAYALLLAEELKLSPEDQRIVQVASLIQDMAAKEEDLPTWFNQPLTPAQVKQIQSHTLYGAALLQRIPELASLAPLVRHHHEHWDGTGQPDGLAGEDIPRLARILAVAGALEEWTRSTPGPSRLSLDQVISQIQQGGGSLFDPECVEAVLRVRSALERVLE